MLHFSNRSLRSALWLILFLCICSVASAQAHGDARPKKVGILLVAFGTSVPQAAKAYDVIEAQVRQAFPETPLRWAYTSKMIRHKLAASGTKIPSPAEALAAMADEDFTHVAVQSLHVLPGAEYHGLVQTAHAFAGMPKGLRKVLVGYPLLATSAQLENTARTLLDVVAEQREEGEALVLMGHGTHHPADVVYAAMQYHFGTLDPTVLVGTVEGVPDFEAAAQALQARGLQKALLVPLMAVAGDHAMNDMAGEEAGSLKTLLQQQGVACRVLLQGLADAPALAALWVARLRDAMSHFEE